MARRAHLATPVAKIRLALAKGKRGPDKRESLWRRDALREMSRSFKGRFRL